MENKNTIHFKQRLLLNCLSHDLEIVTVNGGDSISQYHTQLTVAKFTGNWKKNWCRGTLCVNLTTLLIAPKSGAPSGTVLLCAPANISKS
jgi:hypothetical protein